MDREKSNSKILQDLGERVKELGALHKTARILQDGSRSISEMMTMIVNLLPDAWQYPEITTARIKYQDLIFTTDNFQKSEWYQKTSFKLRSGETGSIEIYYLKEMPELYEGPFLAEERELINTLAEMLRLYFQQKIDEQAIQQAHDNLEQLVKARTAELSESNKALAEEIAEHKKTERKIAEYQKQLQKLASELSISEARERRAIAEELHDYIGQSLAFMKMKLSDLKNDLVKPVNLKIMSEINSLLEQTIQYTRDLTLQISPPVLYELGLVAALEWLAEQFGKKYGLNIEITAAENQPLLQEEVKVVLFKSVNELLNNVVKHANAHQVTLEMFRDGQQVIIEVEDDGDGFELDSLESGSASEWRFGLFSIRERLKYLGGHMEIRSVPGKGTRAMLAAPLKI